MWAEKYKNSKTIKSWFDNITGANQSNINESFNDLIIPTSNGLHIISSHLGLIDVDMELASLLTGAHPNQYKASYIKTFSYIKNALNGLKSEYDYVIFDCPPNFSIVTKNAIVASDYYIVPAKMDYLSTLGIQHIQNHVNSLCSDYNTFCKDIENSFSQMNIDFLGVVATMIQFNREQPLSSQQNYISQLMKSDIKMFDTKIRENKTYYSDAEPTILKNYNNPTFNNIKTELNKFIDEVIEKVGE